MSSLSETIFNQVKAQHNGDEAAARAWIEDVQVDKAALDEACSIFPSLDHDVVRQVLAECSSDVDRAIPLLFERDTQQRRDAHAADKIRLMEEAFTDLPPALIGEIVKKHDGDIGASSAELLRIMQERQEQEELALLNARKESARQKHEHSRLARQRFLEHCVQTFDCLARDEIVNVIGNGGGDDDVARIVATLTELSQQRKQRNLIAMYSSVDAAQVSRVLAACGYDMLAACEALSNAQQHAADGDSAPDAKQQLDRTIVEAKRAMESEAPLDALTDAALQALVRRAVDPVGEADVADAKGEPQVPADAPAAAYPEGFSVQLLVDRTVFGLGDACTVRLQASGGAVSNYDWVTLQRCDASAPLTWQWYQPSLSFTLTGHGKYQFHYYRKVNGSPQLLASSITFLCGPDVHLDVHRAHDTWTVAWAASADTEPVTSSAWIGLYDAACRDNRQYLAFRYIAVDSRSLAFKAPHINGRYEFRFFASRSGCVATSEAIAVALTDSVSVSHTDTPKMAVETQVASVEATRCWVGVFHANEERSRYYRRYSWITTPTQRFEFKTPIHAGTYEARVYNGQGDILARSEHFIVA